MLFYVLGFISLIASFFSIGMSEDFFLPIVLNLLWLVFLILAIITSYFEHDLEMLELTYTHQKDKLRLKFRWR